MTAELDLAVEAFSRLEAVLRATPIPTRSPESAEHSDPQSEPEVKREWVAARDRLDRILRRRRIIHQQLETLTRKLQLEQEFLVQLMARESTTSKESPGLGNPAHADSKQPADTAPSEQHVVSPIPTTVARSTIGLAHESVNAPVTTDQRLLSARRGRDEHQRELRTKQQRLEFLDRSIDVFEQDLKNSRDILLAREEELRAATATTSATKSLDVDGQSAADGKLQDIRDSVARERATIAETESVLSRLSETRRVAASEIRESEKALNAANLWLLLLESPLAPTQTFRWITEHGPKIVGVLLVVGALWGLSRVIEQRVILGLALRRRPDNTEHNGRLETLRRVFRSFSDVALVTLGGLAALDQAGVNVTVLLGGAAVLGASIAFGSQNLIRDYFSGFMILIENQYNVGSVIHAGSKSGVVEDISLRITVLRDEEGVVHFIPHSQMAVVSNMTYGWARAVMSIAIDYREDVDRAMEVLKSLAQQMQVDPQFGPLITSDAELQGIDNLGESSVVIKVLIKTRPIQQWTVKREFLRRVKNRFDQLGIAFAFPQQVLHVDEVRFHPAVREDGSARDRQQDPAA